MITFRQKEYSTFPTKLSYGFENIKERLIEQKRKRLEKITSPEFKSDEVTKRAARVELRKDKYSQPRSKMNIKRDSIRLRNEVESTLKNPKQLVRKAGKGADSLIQFSIKHPKPIIGALGGVALPVGVAMVNPVAGAVTATMPIGTAINLAPMSKKTNKKLKMVARKYNSSQFSKRLRGVKR